MTELKLDINFSENRFLMFIMDELADKKEREGNKEVIRLTLGKSELPLHSDIVHTMQEAMGDLRKSSLVYPAGLPELKQALAEYYKQSFHVQIAENNIIISLGTSSIFRNLFALLLSADSEVLLPMPYYSLYRFSAMLTGADIRYYSIDLDTRKVDFESFKRGMNDKTKVVVINSPGNPLGNVLTTEDLYEMDRIVDGKAVIVNDEIYANTYFDRPNKSVMELKNTKSSFITTSAFSKAYRMYSRRVGYCIVPDELVEPMTVIQHHTLLTVDPVVQFGAVEALKKPEEVVALTALYKRRRDYAVLKLSGIAGIRPIYAEGGFYLTVDCKEYMQKNHFGSSFELAKDIFSKKLVAVVPGSDFGLPYAIRLSFSNQRFSEGMDRLEKYFKEGADFAHGKTK